MSTPSQQRSAVTWICYLDNLFTKTTSNPGLPLDQVSLVKRLKTCAVVASATQSAPSINEEGTASPMRAMRVTNARGAPDASTSTSIRTSRARRDREDSLLHGRTKIPMHLLWLCQWGAGLYKAKSWLVNLWTWIHFIRKCWINDSWHARDARDERDARDACDARHFIKGIEV